MGVGGFPAGDGKTGWDAGEVFHLGSQNPRTLTTFPDGSNFFAGQEATHACIYRL